MKETIDKVIKTPRHVFVYFNNKIKLSQDEINQIEQTAGGTMLVGNSWGELSRLIAEKPKLIMCHIDMIERGNGTVAEFMMMVDILSKYQNVKPAVAVVIESVTPLTTVKQLQKEKVQGIIPGLASWPFSEKLTGINAVTAGESYWPKHIISSLSGPERKKKMTATSLTERQQQVFDLIAKRGLSNKQLAKLLHISESTVKIHVSSIMKTLCVRNRTQLALTKL